MKQKKIASLLLAALVFSAVPQVSPFPDSTITAEAHGGRTDSRGGHKDNKNASGLGSYHYHCGGHPAHLHSGGVCPYSSTGSSAAAPAEQIPQTAAVQQQEPGWHKDETGWRYYYSDLTCAADKWELIDGIYYCFDDRGYLYQNTHTPDGYWVNENGEWKE